MPVRKTSGNCYKVENTPTKKCQTKTQAEKNSYEQSKLISNDEGVNNGKPTPIH